MKIHYNIEQGSEEWHRIRWAKIGGTRGHGLLVKSDTLAIEVLAELTEDYQDEDSFLSKDMQRGNELEPVARERLEEYTGITFKEAGWIQCETKGLELLGMSPDGISKDETVMCEIKCFARKKHMETAVNDAIPRENIRQCIHAFIVNPKLRTMYFCSFRPEQNVRQLFVKKLTRESEVDVGLTEKGSKWEDRGHGLKEYSCKVPMIRTVDYWVDQAMIAAHALNKEIDVMKEKLEF